MNPTINDSYRFCAPAWEINERLIYHSQPGGMLAGLRYDVEGTKQSMGEDSYPAMQFEGLQLREAISPGGPRTADHTKKNAPVAPMQTLRYRCSFSRTKLLFRRNPLDATSPKGAMEWLALIIDAIETTRDGLATIDTSLDGSIVKPTEILVEENDNTESAYHFILEVSLYPQPHCRGERQTTLA
jgi:hypothetical protein